MGFKCGVVGLPNVGKSTLFNALTETILAEAANYPFCTIEPNIGRVAVPDERLEKLQSIAGSIKILPTFIDIMDIAGLVKGASKGEGLGNKFLGNIREVDAVIHVVRCFDDPNISHVEKGIDPIRDIDLIETELMLADLDSLEQRLVTVKSKNKNTQDKKSLETIAIMEKCLSLLAAGQPAREALKYGYSESDLRNLQLISTKPYLYLCNIQENDFNNPHVSKVKNFATSRGVEIIVISAKVEAEIAQISDAQDKKFFLEELGLEESGLNKLIKCGYKILGLTTFFTVGPKETRAWTIKKDTNAPQAAGVIHTDFERGFIKAEVIGYSDYVQYKGESGCKDHGKLRIEGKEYKVQDGDIIHFRFNV